MQTCLVNLFHLDPARNGGASRVAKEFSRLLAGYARTGQLHVVFAVGWKFADEFPAWLGDNQINVIPCLPEVGLTPLFKTLTPDILVSPLFGMTPFDRPDDYPQVPHIASLPDVALALDRPDFFSPDEVEQRKQLYARLHYASRVVTVSEYSRECLIRLVGLLPEKTVVVPLAGDHLVESHGPSESKISQPYIFYPANAWPYKRHALLIQIMIEIWKVRPDVKLVLAGWFEPHFISTLMQQYGCQGEQIINLGYIASDSQLATLYRRAEALLYMSDYESFGMPLLEAMGNGCPVMCAPSTAIPEVAGDAALYVDSHNPADWAEVFLRVLPIRRSEFVEKGFLRASLFTWKRSHTGWANALTEAGLRLAPSNSPEQEQPKLPLKTVAQELAVWSHHHAVQQEALRAQQTEIQALTAALQRKEEAIQRQQDELIANEQRIQSLLVSPRP